MASEAVQTSERYLFNESLTDDNFKKTSLRKRVVYASDSNQGAYNNAIVNVDVTNQWSGMGVSTPPEYRTVTPYIISQYVDPSSTGTFSSGSTPNAYSVGLKAGTQIIDRIDVSIQGKTASSGQPFSNLYNNVRLQTDTSLNYQNKNGASSFVIMDNEYPLFSQTATTSNGDGFSNNITLFDTKITTSATSPPLSLNNGLLQRLKACVPATNGSSLYSWPTQNAASRTNAIQNGKGIFIPSNGTGGSSVYQAGDLMGTWIYMISTELTDLHDIFQRIPLLKNPQIKLTIYYNAGIATINTTTSANQISLSNVTMSGGNTVPFIISSAASNNPNNGLFTSITAANKISYAFGPVTNAKESVGSRVPFNQVRLYGTFYDLEPEKEKMLLERPLRRISFNDVFIQQFKDIAANSTFNLSVQSSHANMQWIALIPFVNGNSCFATSTGSLQFQSPFDSAPWTCAPANGLYNLNVTIGSENVYNNLLSYDFQSFGDEISNINALNGNDTRYLANGLLNFTQWQNAYKYYLFDVSRVSTDIPQNVTISAQSQTDCRLDFYVIIVKRRGLTINQVTSEVSDLIN